jgi:hypothetical protein
VRWSLCTVGESTGETFAAATVGIGHGSPLAGFGAEGLGCGACPLALGGRWRWPIAGDAMGVDVAWLSAGEPVVLLGVEVDMAILELAAAGFGGGTGLAGVPGSSGSRRRLLLGFFSLRPSPVAFSRIWCLSFRLSVSASGRMFK